MEPVLFLTLVFLIGVLGSFIGSVAAGAGLITVPGLLLLGVPPHISLGSAKFATLGFRIGSFINYFKYKKIIWELVIPWTIIGVVGATIGTLIVVQISQELLEGIVGIALILLLPFLFLKKGTGTVRKKISKRRTWFSHILFFFATVWSGFFSPGTGFFTTYLSVYGYRLTILQSKGTIRIPLAISSLSSLYIFFIELI